MDIKPNYDPAIHHRRSIRLKGYDYSQEGLYYVTICCQGKICRYGNVDKGEMILSDAGKMISNQWLELLNRFPNIKLHEYIVMPNHFHGILEIVYRPITNNDTRVGAPLVGAQNTDVKNENVAGAPTVGDMMDAFKSITTVEYIRGVKNLGWPPFDKKLWQRNYWEHIIRDEKSYLNISEYIINNPLNWIDDKLNPGNQEIKT